MKKQRQKQRGFTLIESVVSMTILGSLMLSVNMFMKPVTDLWVIQTFRDGAQSEGRLALMRAIREISQVKNPQSVLIAESARFKFVTAQNETITYRLDGTQLLRNDKLFAASVDQFVLTYWDVANNEIGTPAVSPLDTNIYRVGVSIRANGNGHTATLRSQVRPRNLYG